MPLKLYTYKIKKEINQKVDFLVSYKDNPEVIMTWKNHPNLYGWMKSLYIQNKGRDPHFNCSNILLNTYDLNKLRDDIINNALPKTSGFNFGISSQCDTERTKDLEFIKLAMDSLQKEYYVFFRGSW